MYSLFVTICLLYLVSGCTSDDLVCTSEMGNRKLTATIEGQDIITRVTVGEEGEVSWIEGDEIGVFGEHARNVQFRSSGSGTSSTFIGDLVIDEAIEWAYYPYNEKALMNAGVLTFTLPTQYTYTGNSYAPMLGNMRGNSDNLVFKHLCGLMCITINDLPADADRFVITSVGTEAPFLAGQALVEDVNNEDAVLVIEGEGSYRVTYQLGALAADYGFRSFFVPLPVGEYPQLNVELYAKGASEPYFIRTISNIKVRRAVMIDMPVLDGKTGMQYVLNEKVRELTETLQGKVFADIDNPMKLTYTGVAAEDVPHVGDIVWSRGSSAFPTGFLGKVNKVYQDNGNYVVQTDIAALSEAFDQLYVNEEIILEPEGTTTRAFMPEAFGFNINTELKGMYGTPGNPAYIFGNIGIVTKLTVHVELDKQNRLDLANVLLETSVVLEGGMELKLSTEKKELFEKELTKIDFTPIPLAGGIVWFTPVLEPILRAGAKGEINCKGNFSTSWFLVAGAQYKDGQWEKGMHPRPRKTMEKSPWKYENEFSFEGEMFIGMGLDFMMQLYSQPKMKLGLGISADLKLTGEVKIDNSNSHSLTQTLNDATLTSSVVLGGQVKVDPSLLVPGDQKWELKFLELELWKRQVNLLPTFKDLLGSLTKKETQSGDTFFEVDVDTETSGDVLADTKIQFALKNQKTGIVEQTSTSVDYVGGTDRELTEEENPKVPKAPQKVAFKNLKQNTTYEIYPIVKSSVVNQYTKGDGISLENQVVELSTELSERDVLIALYNSAGGDGWTHNDNWCSDKPLNEWYGVTTNNEGKVVSIFLSDNNLKGTIEIDGLCCLEKFQCYSSNRYNRNLLTALTIKNCGRLLDLKCQSNELVSLNIDDCINLKILYLGGNLLTEFDLGRFTSLEYFDCSRMKQFSLQNIAGLPNLYELGCICSGFNVLNVSGCTRLEKLFCGGNPLVSLNVSGCYSLSCIEFAKADFDDYAFFYEDMKLDVLQLTDCVNLEVINGGGCNYPVFKKIYLAKPLKAYQCVQWGGYNPDLYTFPVHMDGWQYPEFIYK